jgi:hypothetical protein
MLKRVTFTGPDDHTSIDEMLAISKEHPHVEWGILFPSKGGRSRFPSDAWVGKLIDASLRANVQLSGHLCEPWVAKILAGEMHMMAFSGFSRFQLNTHGVPMATQPHWYAPLVRMGYEIILQLDGLMSEKLRADLGGRHSDVFSGLHDLSHGAGVLPTDWPRTLDIDLKWVGFAGGLGPHNLAEQLPLIEQASGGADYWIDMETHVRTDGLFDLQKVRECLRICDAFMATNK